MVATGGLKFKSHKVLGYVLGFLAFLFFNAMSWGQNATSSAATNPGNTQALQETPIASTDGASLNVTASPIPTAGYSSTPVPEATASDSLSDSSNDFSLSPEDTNKILKVIDANANTSTAGGASANNAAMDQPPPVPTGISVIVLKEGVYLSWNTAPAGSSVVSYNVYRSTTPGYGYKKVNLNPLTVAYFLDGPLNSLDNPQNGEDYFYVVAAVDGAGNVSPYSEEVPVSPTGMNVPSSAAELREIQEAKGNASQGEQTLNIPEQGVINFKLPADSDLSIQGYKTVEAELAFQTFNRPNINGVSNQVNTTTINQELVVNLKGQVGKNVDVNINYSDVNRAGGLDQTQQQISIVYHGDSDSAIQQVSFGDLQLNLPNTEFAGFNKQLFGLEALLKFGPLQFTSFFAQTQGIAVTKVFTGNTTQVNQTYQDISFIPLKYFLITRTPSGAAPTGTYLPQPNSEQIWVNNGTNQINPVGANFQGYWEKWLPGRDYTIDYTTGIITFLTALTTSAQIAVGFTDMGGVTHGLNSPQNNPLTTSSLAASNAGNLAVPDNGYIDNTHFLIKDSTIQTDKSSTSSVILSPLYLVNYFSTGVNKIIPPQQDPGFLFQVISEGTNDIIQTGQGGTAATPYVYNLNLDLNVLSVTNVNDTPSPGGPYTNFPERPFANQDGGSTGVNGIGVTDVYAPTGGIPTSLYEIHLMYKTQLTNFVLGNINILPGSESVYLDGRLLTANKDYSIDYTSGFLDFLDQSILTPSSQIVVTYEYSPFGSFGAENILGARAQYNLSDNFEIGSTFFLSTSQQPTDIPQIGSTPSSLTLFDANASLELSRNDVQSITGMIPGLAHWKPPVTIKLSGEIARSYYDPDTYDINGETGVAMVDNMDGIDNAISASLNQTSWLVSSAPAYDYVDPSVSLVCADVPSNNRTRFYDDVVTPNVDFGVNTSTAIPGGGGHVFAETGQASDVVNVLQFPYAHLSDQSWAGLRQVLSTAGDDFSNVQYFQAWVYNDGNDKWIMFDFGVINESSNGDPLLDSDAVTNQANPNQAYGIPTFYMPGTPWYYAGSKSDFNFTPDASGQVGFIGLNGEVSQEGQNNGVYITQNMNGTGVLNTTDSYFEYGVRANWKGWQLVKIPVNLANDPTDFQSTTSSGLSYFFHNQNDANPLIIRTLRLWVTGAGPATIHGTFLTDSISFTNNLWELQVDPSAAANLGVTVNTNKFDVNSISQAQNASYSPDMRFVVLQPGQNQNSVQLNETALDLTYNLSSADYNPPGNIDGTPIYYATRDFQQGLDFTDYQDLRMDMNIRSYNPGEIFFVRIGNDQEDYYQYNLPLNGLAANCLDTWGTVIIPIDGSGGNMLKVGTPFINKVTQISFGVLSPNAPTGKSGELWIDNLRTTNTNVRSGLARRVNAELDLGNDPKKPFATVDALYREVDSGFTEIDQTSTHFQHSLQYGLSFASNEIYLFGQPLEAQFSWNDQELYTEAALINNPYYLDLPNTDTQTMLATILYNKDFGKNFGRLTNLNVSGSTSSQNEVYQSSYLDQPGVQGNTQLYEGKVSVLSTYDLPTQLFSFPIGSNQLTETFSLTHDTQYFSFDFLAPYDRTTRVQSYSWSNTTEILKDLVFTPGYTLSLTDAVGNTNTPGVSGGVDSYTPFLQQYAPKAGLVYRGIPGLIPSVTYTGSNQYDYEDYPGQTRLTTANNINYSVNMTPGSWVPLFRKINLVLFGGETDGETASIPMTVGAPPVPLTFSQKWLIDPPYNQSILATQSTTDQLNASFTLFNVWDFRPTGSWTNQNSLLYQGSNPSKEIGQTLGLTTIYNQRLFTLPWLHFSFNSAQLQYTQTDSTQYDTSDQAIIDNQTSSNMYALTFPYEVNKFSQGNMRFQVTLGYQNGLSTTNIPTWLQDYQGSIEYDQKFAPDMMLYIPFTHWRIQLHDSIVLKATFMTEFIDNNSSYSYNQVQSQSYRTTVEFDYNALKNLQIGLSGINQFYTDTLDSQLSYVLWQVNLSGEAKF